MNFLVVGDIVGMPGMEALRRNVSKIKERFNIDFTIVNGENSADGMGITHKILKDMYALGVDVVTLGNHTWGKKDIFTFIDEEERLIRPANYPKGVRGKGSTIISCKGKKIGVLNLIGRVEMGGSFDSPFEVADEEIEKLKVEGADIIVVDFHAEATAEKKAMGYYLDGRVTALLGTHTHVQTADEIILPNKTAYITDVGMTGAEHSVLGVDTALAIEKQKMQYPVRFVESKEPCMINAVVVSFDEKTGKSYKIVRINER